ncbi:MAG: hypothetical protein L3J23_02585 [Flavobacteriaceae bacterium]|nr:hypothetical protein [Flavobacteriaceae bacterium]
MRYLYIIIILTLIVLFSSCRKDFNTIRSSGNLKFSKDTVFFNRVFDATSTSTKRFTVKNTSNDAITIPTISLGNGENSFYRLNVDGIAGKSFENIDILAKDSIFVFVEATINFDAVDADFMYRDDILFDAGSNEQKVELEALVLDVHLIRPDRIELEEGFDYETIGLGIFDQEGEEITIRGSNLVNNTIWGDLDDKPYLIYNYVGVPSGKTLTINAGTQLHFHANSGIIVQNGGTLIVNGELDNQVVFQGDRLEEFYEDIPGQWGTIWLFNGSKNSVLNHTTIKNATIGLFVDSDNAIVEETLVANNTQIYNTSSYGILARNAKITAKNLVIGNNGQASFNTVFGGVYNFTHATFANYWRNSNRQEPTVFLTNLSAISENNLTANFTNCIIDGNQNLEFVLKKGETSTFNFKFKNCMLKFNDVSNNFTDTALFPLYDFENTSFYENIIREGDAKFKNTNTLEGITDLRIGEDSAAKGLATFLTSDVILQKDILGFNRTNPSDIGAYNFMIFEDED